MFPASPLTINRSKKKGIFYSLRFHTQIIIHLFCQSFSKLRKAFLGGTFLPFVQLCPGPELSPWLVPLLGNAEGVSSAQARPRITALREKVWLRFMCTQRRREKGIFQCMSYLWCTAPARTALKHLALPPFVADLLPGGGSRKTLPPVTPQGCAGNICTGQGIFPGLGKDDLAWPGERTEQWSLW